MDSNKFKLVLAMTVLTVPLVFTTGCGKKAETTPVDTVTETVSTTPIPETIEEDLTDEGIEVTPTPEAEEVLDDSEMYVGDMYAVGEISVYAEPSEDAEVISTLSDGEKVTALGILHEAEFYKVSTDDTLEGYVRTVDLEDEGGDYTEENNEVVTAEETAPEETKPEETADPVVDTANGVSYDSEAGILYVVENGEVVDSVTKAEIESWGMTVEQYIAFFNNPSGGSSTPSEELNDGECVGGIDWGSGHGAVGGTIQ